MDEATKLIYGLDYDKELLEQDGDGPHHGPHYVVLMGDRYGWRPGAAYAFRTSPLCARDSDSTLFALFYCLLCWYGKW